MCVCVCVCVRACVRACARTLILLRHTGMPCIVRKYLNHTMTSAHNTSHVYCSTKKIHMWLAKIERTEMRCVKAGRRRDLNHQMRLTAGQ